MLYSKHTKYLFTKKVSNSRNQVSLFGVHCEDCEFFSKWEAFGKQNLFAEYNLSYSLLVARKLLQFLIWVHANCFLNASIFLSATYYISVTILFKMYANNEWMEKVFLCTQLKVFADLILHVNSKFVLRKLIYLNLFSICFQKKGCQLKVYSLFFNQLYAPVDFLNWFMNA